MGRSSSTELARRWYAERKRVRHLGNEKQNTEFEDRYQGEQYKREGAIHLFLRQVLLCSACQCSCWHLMEQYEVFQQQWYIASSSQL